MRYQDGRAWIIGCGRCMRPIVEAHVNGVKVRLSRKGVPVRDAMVLGRYLEIVVNIWNGAEQLYATPWSYTAGPPFKGHLFVNHHCGVR